MAGVELTSANVTSENLAADSQLTFAVPGTSGNASPGLGSATAAELATFLNTQAPLSSNLKAGDIDQDLIYEPVKAIIQAMSNGNVTITADDRNHTLTFSASSGGGGVTLDADTLYPILANMLVGSTSVTIDKSDSENTFTFNSTGSSGGGSSVTLLDDIRASSPSTSQGFQASVIQTLATRRPVTFNLLTTASIPNATNASDRVIQNFDQAIVRHADGTQLSTEGWYLRVAGKWVRISSLTTALHRTTIPSTGQDSDLATIAAIRTYLSSQGSSTPTRAQVLAALGIAVSSQTYPRYLGVGASSTGFSLTRALQLLTGLPSDSSTLIDSQGLTASAIRGLLIAKPESLRINRTQALPSTRSGGGALRDGDSLYVTNNQAIPGDVLSTPGIYVRVGANWVLQGARNVLTDGAVSIPELPDQTGSAAIYQLQATRPATGSTDSTSFTWDAQSAGVAALPDLTDVTVTNPAANQVLSRNDANSGWENRGLSLAEDLDDLNDVTVTSPAAGQVLQRTAANDGWRNNDFGFNDLKTKPTTDSTLDGNGVADPYSVAFASATTDRAAEDVRFAFYTQVAGTLTQDLSAYDYNTQGLGLHAANITVSSSQQVALAFPKDRGVFFAEIGLQGDIALSKVTSGLSGALNKFDVFTGNTGSNSGMRLVGIRRRVFTFEPAINIDYEGQVQPLTTALASPATVSTSLVVQGTGPADSPIDVPALTCVTTGTATATTISASVVQSTQASTVIRSDLLNLLPTATSQSSFTLNAATNYVWLGVSTAETRSPTLLRPQGQTGTTQDIALTFVTTLGTFRIYRGNTTAVTTAATYQIFSAACVFQPSSRFNLVTTEPMAGSGSSSDPVNFTEIETEAITAEVVPYDLATISKTGVATGTLTDYAENNNSSFTQISTSATMQVSIAVAHRTGITPLQSVVLRAIDVTGTQPANIAASPAGGNTTILSGHIVYTFTIPVNPTMVTSRVWDLHFTYSGNIYHAKSRIQISSRNLDPELHNRLLTLEAQAQSAGASRSGGEITAANRAVLNVLEVESTTTAEAWHLSRSAPRSNVRLTRVMGCLFDENRRNVGTANYFGDIPLNRINITPTLVIFHPGHVYLQPEFGSFINWFETTGVLAFTQGDTSNRLSDEKFIMMLQVGLDNTQAWRWAPNGVAAEQPFISLNDLDILRVERGQHERSIPGLVATQYQHSRIEVRGKDNVSTVTREVRDQAYDIVDDRQYVFFQHTGVNGTSLAQEAVFQLPDTVTQAVGESYTVHIDMEYYENDNNYGLPNTPIVITIADTSEDTAEITITPPIWSDPAGRQPDHRPAGLNLKYKYFRTYTDGNGRVIRRALQIKLSTTNGSENYYVQVYGTHEETSSFTSFRPSYPVATIPDVIRSQYPYAPSGSKPHDVHTLVLAFGRYNEFDTSADPMMGVSVMFDRNLANPQVGDDLVASTIIPTGYTRSELMGANNFNPKIKSSAGLNIANVQVFKYSGRALPDLATMQFLNDHVTHPGAGWFEFGGLTSRALKALLPLVLDGAGRTEFLRLQVVAHGSIYRNLVDSATGTPNFRDFNATTNLRRGEEETFRGILASADGQYGAGTWLNPVSGSAVQNFDVTFEAAWDYWVVVFVSHTESSGSGNFTERQYFPLTRAMARIGPDNALGGKGPSRLDLLDGISGLLRYSAASSGPIPIKVSGRLASNGITPIGARVSFPGTTGSGIASNECVGFGVYRVRGLGI